VTGSDLPSRRESSRGLGSGRLRLHETTIDPRQVPASAEVCTVFLRSIETKKKRVEVTVTKRMLIVPLSVRAQLRTEHRFCLQRLDDQTQTVEDRQANLLVALCQQVQAALVKSDQSTVRYRTKITSSSQRRRVRASEISTSDPAAFANERASVPC
jgi:hypothetical protein